MREFMRIVESADQNRLYHGTSITGLCNIAHANFLGAYGGEDQASFTLSNEIASRFAISAVENTGHLQLAQWGDYPEFHDGIAFVGEKAAGGHGAVMIFDRAALHRDYDFKAVNFQSDNLETVDFGYPGDELEECVFGDVANLDRYLVGISINGFAQYYDVISKVIGQEEMEILNAGRNWVQRFAK